MPRSKPLATRRGRELLRRILETDDKLVLRPWGGYTLLKAQKNVRKNIADALVRHGLIVPTEEIPYVYRPSNAAEADLRLAEGDNEPLLQNAKVPAEDSF